MPEQTELVNLTIDGRPVSVPKGTLIWAAARQLGIEIPIYCYHPKMDPLGACRMCFVAVEKMPKLQTACTTVVTEGMVVSTSTPAVKKARRGTLEFLLINHPLDCPICDKGGECTLQDFTLRHGPGASRFDVAKRHYPKPIPVSEHILLDRERCIACQRCVRFCQDVAQEPGLIMKQRGFQTEVGTDPEAPFDSIFSGNVVEMCPVGALTARSYRFVARPWELKRTPSVCANCAVGCNVLVDVRVDKALRQYSRTNDAIDDGWLCDRGRWGLDAVNAPDRLRTPLIRQDGALRPATWEAALALVARRLGEIARRDGPQAIGGIGSTHTTNEEAYLFQKLLRAVIGTNNVDHHHGRFPAPAPGALPWVWTGSIAGLDRAGVIVLLGADPYQRQPVLDLRLRKAIRAGAKVYILTAAPTRLDRLAVAALRYQEGQAGTVARALLARVRAEGLAHGTYADEARGASAPEDAAALAATAGVALEGLRAVARAFAGAAAATILYDEAATLEPSGGTLAADALELALLADQYGKPGAGAGPLLEDANSLGARDMGLLPDTLPGYAAAGDEAARRRLGALWGGEVPAKPGLAYDAMLAGGVKALYVLGANPARHADLSGSEFLVVQDLTLTETAQRADVVLPAVSYAEKDGSFTNTERCVQAVRRAMIPLPGARADWEILRGVARALNLDWAYRGPGDVLAEIGRTVPIYAGLTRRALGASGLRWPIIASGVEGDGAAPLAGSPYLTGEMLR
ncbi:MAG TPA: NADH-quinone oxidoreductase subunit NuoG, partial [Ktedonobacterales bacterium]|nr:NADH-quinone oxidoreductase subunit NuoG [Ktedonobacterales bacterium]